MNMGCAGKARSLLAVVFAVVLTGQSPPIVAEPIEAGIHERSAAVLPDVDASSAIVEARAKELAIALGVADTWVTEANLEAGREQVAVLPQFGAIEPIVGDRLVVMSTGSVGAGPARPGTTVRRDADGSVGVIRLRVKLDPPSHGRQLSFRYRFLTAEFPEFTAKGSQDVWSVRVMDANGSREILRMNSGDPLIEPVSMDNAAGTGFALFSQQPGVMDGDFSIGLPRAGITGWQEVSEPLAQVGPVELEFELRDSGDGIIDSAVVLNGLSLDAVRLERAAGANSMFWLPEMQECMTRPQSVSGAVADGVTRINHRFINLSGPGDVTYSLPAGQAPLDGGYGVVGGWQRLQSFTVRAVPSSGGGWEAVAQYLVPEEFNRGGNENAASRFVLLRVRFEPDDLNEPVSTASFDFSLWRPPVILVHGVWSNAAKAWGQSPLRRDNRLRTFLADYGSTNASRFSTNLLAPVLAIREACEYKRARGITLSRVDYIGHSMGSLLGRNFDTLSPNIVNKFITVNAPHLGSPLANVLVTFRDTLSPPARLIATRLMRAIGMAIDAGAVDDLSVGSAAIGQIQATHLPSHALVGIGGTGFDGDDLVLLPYPLNVLFEFLRFQESLYEMFPGVQHDSIVGRASQQGGIAESAYSVLTGLDSLHTRATNSEQYRQRIITLLNAQATSSLFSHFPAPSEIDVWNPPRSQLQIGDYVEGRIELVEPLAGTVFKPGQAVQVSIKPIAGFDVQQSLVIGPDVAAPMQGGLSSIIEIPIEFLGSLQISALAKDGQGAWTSAEPVEVLVQTDLALQSIEIVQRNLILVDHTDWRQVQVLGLFSDGIHRDISHSSTGTVFSSSNPAVAQITGQGVLMPISEGVATIIASNRGRQDSITVRVSPIEQLIFANGFEP